MASGDVAGSMAQARVVLVAVSKRTLVPAALVRLTHVGHGPALVQRVLPPDAANQPNTLPVAARLRMRGNVNSGHEQIQAATQDAISATGSALSVVASKPIAFLVQYLK